MNPSIGPRIPPAAAVSSRDPVTSYVFAGMCLPTWTECERLLSSPDGARLLGIWTVMGRYAENTAMPGWLIDGHYRGLGLGELAQLAAVTPETMATALSELEKLGIIETKKIKFEHAGISAFLHNTCVRKSSAWIGVKRLRLLYADWCERNGRPPLSTTQFRRQLLACGFREGRSRRVNGVQIRTWEGLCDRRDAVRHVGDVAFVTV